MRRSACPALSLVCVLASCGCGARSNLLESRSAPLDAAADDAGMNDAGTDAGTADAVVDATGDTPVSDTAQDAVVVTACPDAPPDLGASCDFVGQVCAYTTGKVGPCDDVGTDDRVAWRCETDGWLEVARCVEWGPCPQAQPVDGDACDSDLIGLDCFYSSPPSSCAAGSIAQCDGAAWRQVNACPARVPPDAFLLVDTVTGGDVTAVLHPEQQVQYPSLALAGTQLFLSYSVSAGYLQDHAVYGHVLQTAARTEPVTHEVASQDLLGIDAVSNPVATHRAGMFTLAWAANDGWPVHTSGVPGLYLRNVPLHDPPYSSPLVDESGSAPTALAMQPGGGRIAYRYPVPGMESKYAAAVVVLSSKAEPAPLTKVTLADETLSDWFAPPVPNAVVRIVPWGHGFVYAYPVIASGDLWDDSGIRLLFYATADTNEDPASLRVTIGLPRRISVAALSDGSVVVAYAGVESMPEGGPPFHLVQAWEDGTWLVLPDPPQPGTGELLGSGPVVVPFEDGFAVGWTSFPIESPSAVGWPRVMVRTGNTLDHQVMWGGDAVQGMTPSDRLDLAWGRVDRTLHVAWERSGTLSVVERQRLIVRPL